MSIFIGVVSFVICKQFEINHSEIGLTPRMTTFLGIIFVPFYDEIIFRSLLKFEKKNILLFIFTLIALIAISVVRAKTNFTIMLSILLFSFIGLLAFFPLNKIEQVISFKVQVFFLLIGNILCINASV